jgi:hypothetical protein
MRPRLTAEINGARQTLAKYKICKACPCIFCNSHNCMPRPFHLKVRFSKAVLAR